MISLILLLLTISIFAGIITRKRSIFTRLVGTFFFTYIVLGIYWAAGIHYTNEYEPDMFFGWLIISTIGNIFIIPASYFIGKLSLKYKNEAT